jgi:hypothetical protein
VVRQPREIAHFARNPNRFIRGNLDFEKMPELGALLRERPAA